MVYRYDGSQIWSQRECLQFLFQLGLAQQIAQRRTEIIKVLERGLSRLAFPGNVKICVVRIDQEELFLGFAILPSHSSGFFQPQDATLAARNAGSLVNLNESSFEAFQLVVMIIDRTSCCANVDSLAIKRNT